MTARRRSLARLSAAATLALLLAGAGLSPAGSCCPPPPEPLSLLAAAPCCGGCAATLERAPVVATISLRLEAPSPTGAIGAPGMRLAESRALAAPPSPLAAGSAIPPPLRAIRPLRV